MLLLSVAIDDFSRFIYLFLLLSDVLFASCVNIALSIKLLLLIHYLFIFTFEPIQHDGVIVLC